MKETCNEAEDHHRTKICVICKYGSTYSKAETKYEYSLRMYLNVYYDLFTLGGNRYRCDIITRLFFFAGLLAAKKNPYCNSKPTRLGLSSVRVGFIGWLFRKQKQVFISIKHGKFLLLREVFPSFLAKMRRWCPYEPPRVW